MRIRSKVNKLVYQLSDAASIEALAESPLLGTVNWRMKRRLVQKIRTQAHRLGYDPAELEKHIAVAATKPVAAKKPVVPAEPVIPAEAMKKPVPAEPVVPAEAVKKPVPAEPVASKKPEAPTSIQGQVDAEVKVAMKAKDKIALSTLRNIKAALASAAKDAGVEILDDPTAVKTLRKLAKMRQESIDMYDQAGDVGKDRAAAERAELAVIERWLPQYVFS